MATSATPSKLSSAERTLITQGLDYYLKGTNRAITTSTNEPDIQEIHKQKALRISQLIAKLSSNELDL